MGHCRFENTFGDLQDCANALANEDKKELNEYEQEYYDLLIEKCIEIAEDFGYKVGKQCNVEEY